MKENLKKLPLIALISLLPTLLVWLPFFFRLESLWGIPLPREGMATIVANYDGPLYLVVAKTMYDPSSLSAFPFNLPSNYYAAHFPLYPLLIKVFAGIFGFPYSMLFTTVLASILALFFFYLLIKEYVGEKNAMWITFVYSILPARFLIVRSVGAPEPLFMATLTASVYYFKKEKYFLAGLWGALAQLTKSPAILLFIAYFFTIFIPFFKSAAIESTRKLFDLRHFLKYWGILLIPLALLTVFWVFKVRLDDFLAYFHSGDNIHLFFPPFQIFNFSLPWVGTFWLEEIIFVYIFGIFALINLVKENHIDLAWIVGIFFTSLLFVSHRDLVRYGLPIVPFLFVAFSKTISAKDFRIVVALLLIPIYLYSLVFISQNVMPVGNWAPLL